VVPLTWTFSFRFNGKSVAMVEEFIDASLGAARHEQQLGEPFLI
jgi:hypothetical protein